MSDMKVSIMEGIGKVAFTRRPVPVPKSGEVLVKLEYVGVCGSDLHYYEHGAIGDLVVEPPFVLGHECSGVVTQLGDGVTHLKVGDRVALEPGKTCGHCEFCRKGLYNLCPDVIFFATPPIDGVFQEYVAHEADLCFKLPETVSTMEGALIEPLAVGFHAAMQGGARAGQTAVVFGSGCIGLVSVLALRAMGLTRVYIVDNIDKRLAKAVELGAAGAVNFAHEDVVQRVLELTEGRGVDIVIDTSGTDAAVDQGVQMCVKGGCMVMVGYSRDGMIHFPMAAAMNKELDIKTVFRYRHIYPMAIDAVAGGNVNLKGIVTDTFDFDELQSALDKCVNNKAEIVKAVIKL